MSTGKGRQMKNSLEHWVAPAFRERRFNGRFPRLRRVIGNELHLVELQFTKWGGGFRLNLAVFPPEGITTKWGQKVGPEQLAFGYPMNRYYLLDPRNVTEGRSRDYWFRFDEKNTDQVAKDFLPHVEVADRWFLTGEAPTPPPERFLDRLVRRMFPRST